MTKPKAVLISDLHFTPSTLELASAALQMALDKARQLKIPLVIAGDTLDTKAVMRAECVNRILDLITHHVGLIFMLVGNHDLLNEKGEEHSLRFLKDYVCVVQAPVHACQMWFFPYFNNIEAFKDALRKVPKKDIIIAHQGVQSAFLGHYSQDRTSLPTETFDGYRVVSGHYHRAQDIKCGETGLFSYIGTPYTISFAEAHDGPKGFKILYEDGTLELIPTNLRKHVILECSPSALSTPLEGLRSDDLLWVKVSAPPSELSGVDKDAVGKLLLGHSNFKLDLIPINNNELVQHIEKLPANGELLDKLILKTTEDELHQKYLMDLWRNVLNADT